jgi:hypothetical protein
MAVFSGPGKLEGLGQVQGGLVQRQSMDRRPEIQDVPLDGTLRVKALEGVLAQVDREGWLRVTGVTVYRTGTTTLLATATQMRHQIHILKYHFHCDVSPQEGEVHLGPRDRVGRRRRLDQRTRGLYGGGGRGDHSLRGQVPLVAYPFQGGLVLI